MHSPVETLFGRCLLSISHIQGPINVRKHTLRRRSARRRRESALVVGRLTGAVGVAEGGSRVAHSYVFALSRDEHVRHHQHCLCILKKINRGCYSNVADDLKSVCKNWDCLYCVRLTCPEKLFSHLHCGPPRLSIATPIQSPQIEHNGQESDSKRSNRQANSWRGPGVSIATRRPSAG